MSAVRGCYKYIRFHKASLTQRQYAASVLDQVGSNAALSLDLAAPVFDTHVSMRQRFLALPGHYDWHARTTVPGSLSLSKLQVQIGYGPSFFLGFLSLSTVFPVRHAHALPASRWQATVSEDLLRAGIPVVSSAVEPKANSLLDAVALV